eukprot:NODE_23_length_38171_cov_0.318108.p2 type:complete len:1043 gc:universal NODE_23_length_38171_cov_0.318108:15298-18426(+)
MLLHLFLISLVEAQNNYDTPPIALDALKESDVDRIYGSEIPNYYPQGWEYLGSQFLNATRNNGPMEQSDVVPFNPSNVASKFAGLAAFTAFSLACALLFCMLTPILACCCGCFKNRTMSGKGRSKNYENAASALMVLSFILFITIGIITGISAGTMNESIAVIGSSVGSVYNGGLLFGRSTLNEVSAIVDLLATYAEDTVDDISAQTINITMADTTGNLTYLSEILKSNFTFADSITGDLSDSILDMNSDMNTISYEYNTELSQYTDIVNNLTDLGASEQIVASFYYHYQKKSPNPFIFSSDFRSNVGFDSDKFPTTLNSSAVDLTRNKGAFQRQADVVVVRMNRQIQNVTDRLNSTFSDFKKAISSNKISLLNRIDNGYVRSFNPPANRYGASLNEYSAKYKEYASSAAYTILGFVVTIFILFVGIIFCIASKKRKLGMSCASLLFLYAAFSLILSVIIFLMAFTVTEICQQLDNPSFTYGNYQLAAAVTIVDKCSQGMPIGDIMFDPIVLPLVLLLNANATDYFNISNQYDKFVSKINMSSFLDTLDIKIEDVSDFNEITEASNNIYQQNLEATNVTGVIPDHGMNNSMLVEMDRVILLTVNNLDVNSFTYIGNSSTDQPACVDDYNSKCLLQRDHIDVLNTDMSNTNLMLPILKNKSEETMGKAASVKDYMANIPNLIDQSISTFMDLITLGKLKIRDKINSMPNKIKENIQRYFSDLVKTVKCEPIGQVVKVMEFELCSKVRNSLNGMWFMLWLLAYVIVITFIGLNLGANILFRDAKDDDDFVKDKKFNKVALNENKIQASAALMSSDAVYRTESNLGQNSEILKSQELLKDDDSASEPDELRAKVVAGERIAIKVIRSPSKAVEGKVVIPPRTMTGSNLNVSKSPLNPANSNGNLGKSLINTRGSSLTIAKNSSKTVGSSSNLSASPLKLATGNISKSTSPLKSPGIKNVQSHSIGNDMDTTTESRNNLGSELDSDSSDDADIEDMQFRPKMASYMLELEANESSFDDQSLSPRRMSKLQQENNLGSNSSSAKESK